jgi:GT2 family glycosyltransferase
LQNVASHEEKLHKISEELQAKDQIIVSMHDWHMDINTKVTEYNQNFKKELEEKDRVIKDQVSHINTLLEQERKLNNILNSDGWKALSKYYKYRDLLFPNNSKRRLVAKMTFKALKNPRQVLKRINKDNIRKLKYYLKTEDPSLLESRIENYLDRHSNIENNRDLQVYHEQDTTKKLVFPVFEIPKVSIIIPVYNQWNFTYGCLKSILENTSDVSYEVIVADDMSTDETVRIQEFVENIRVIRDGTNRGFLLNCNNAAQYADGKYIFFLNNDTNVQPGWLSSLVDLIESDDSIGMVGSKLVYPDGRLQEAGGIIWNDGSGWNYGRLDDPSKPEYNYVKEVDYISGAAIMIRSDLWNQIGGFDERYAPAYCEDSDLAFEIRKRGYKVVYQPKSVVVHFEGISHGTDTSSGLKSYQIRNQQLFIEKWKGILDKEHFANAEHVLWARDRSQNKKTILVIDHYVPHYDKDAGSRTTFQYLKLFVDMGFNVKFLGDNFYQHEPYTSELQQMGVEVFYGVWYRDNYEKWIKEHGQKIDYAYLNRPHISIKYIDLIRKYTNAKIIYYGHDLHYVRELKRYEIEKNEELIKSSEKWKELEFELFAKSDVIVTGSQDEHELIKNAFPNKRVCTIPAFIYDSPSLSRSEQTEGLLFVGGFSHTPNIDAVKWFNSEVFPLVKEKIPGIKCYIVGSNVPYEINELNSDQFIIKGFVSDEELVKLYEKTRLVIVPLRYGAGIKGKTIEAMYHGVPIVSTSYGIEGLKDIFSLVKPCDTAEDFAEEVISLYNDSARMKIMEQCFVDYINKHFSKRASLEAMKEVFEENYVYS